MNKVKSIDMSIQDVKSKVHYTWACIDKAKTDV